MNYTSIESAFSNAMADAGLCGVTHPEADGTLHRFHIDGDKPRSKNGWYCLFSDGIPAGIFGSWKAGRTETWCAKDVRQMDESERRKHQIRIAEARQKRDDEIALRRTEASAAARRQWQGAFPASADHPYLKAKRVPPNKLRQQGGDLLVPLQYHGQIVNLQRIQVDGQKWFLPGGRVSGAYHPIGLLGDELYICEGYATGATVHALRGQPVACAMNAGNLIHVARCFRQRHPELKIVIAADNDADTDGNPGVTKANEAAAAVGGRVVCPDIPGDFNDMAIAQGVL